MTVRPGLNDHFAGVLRHELGHALGQWRHLTTAPPGFSMMAAGYTGPGEATDDDILLFKSIVNLPHEVYMGGYEMSLPDFRNW